MKLFHKLSILRAIFGQPLPETATIEDLRDAVAAADHAAAAPARRWWAAAQADPELLGDVIRLGDVFTTQPFAGGQLAAPIDPLRLAYEHGRRDMALQLATMMTLSIHDLNQLMETNDANR
jgi:hypothetical protein